MINGDDCDDHPQHPRPQALADEIATIPVPADDNHRAEQNHWIDPLDSFLAAAPPDYGPEAA